MAPNHVGFSFLLAFTSALAISLGLVPLVHKFATAMGWKDVPDAFKKDGSGPSLNSRRVHSKPVPRIGGLAIVVSFFMTNFFLAFELEPILGIYFISLIIFALGIIDDVRPLSAVLRLVIQLGCASAVVWSSGLIITEVSLSPQTQFSLPTPVGFFCSVFVIIGAINATNMADGLDGLAGGLILIAGALLSFLYFLRTDDVYVLAMISLPLVGAIFGFLRYNTHPASIFMGDGGSNWLGFVIGVLMLIMFCNVSFDVMGQQGHIFVPIEGPPLPFVAILLTLALPVFDTFSVLMVRLWNRRGLMDADKSHFHHTMLRIGLTHSQSVTALYLLTLVFGLTGVVPCVFPDLNVWWVSYLGAILLVVTILSTLRIDSQFVEMLKVNKELLLQKRVIGPKIVPIIASWESVNRLVVMGILMGAPLFAGVPSQTLGYISVIAAVCMVVSFIYRPAKDDFIESLILSIGAGVLLTTMNQKGMWIELAGERYNVRSIYNGMFVFLFFSTLLFSIATIRRKYFITTPSDFLVLTLPLLFFLVPEPYNSEYHMNIISLRCLVIFVVLRTLARRRKKYITQVRVVTTFALCYFVATSVLGLRIIYH